MTTMKEDPAIENDVVNDHDNLGEKENYTEDEDSDVNEEDEESDDDEEEGQPEDEHIADDDDFALLAYAKQRLAAQKEKEEQNQNVALENEVGDDEQEDEAEESQDEEEDNYGEDEGEDNTVLATVDNSHVVTESKGNMGSEAMMKDAKPEKRVSLFVPEEVPMARRERDENAELWELLRQSKSRVAEVKELVKDLDQYDTDDDTNDGEKDPSNPDDDQEDEKKSDEDEAKKKKDFERENRELWELLQQSKRRLEDAAIAKAKQAEKLAAADDKSKPKAKPMENPYENIDAVPDVPESEEALTQKELLLAMAVAEEASRNGTEVFATPAREELRTRDINSFEFLKEKPKVPDTPIGNDPKEEALERNRLQHLAQTLLNRWSQFRKQLDSIDIASRQKAIIHQRANEMN